jgi:hypothetical protein
MGRQLLAGLVLGLGQHRRLSVAVLLALGLAYRIVAAATLPMVFDEVCIVAHALARGFAHPISLLFEVPIALSNGITPLWVWLQAGPAALFGETSRLGLRTLPVACGLATVLLCYHVTATVAGTRAAFVAGLLAAIHSPFVYAAARGEYSESLFTVLVLLLLVDLYDGGAHPPTRAMIWPAIGLLAYFGKGLLLWLGYVAYLGVAWLVGRRPSQGAATSSAGRSLVLAVLPLLPSLAWLEGAQLTLFRRGAAMTTDLGPVSSVWTNVLRLTVGYGSSAQQFMVSSWHDALFVYTRFDVWPTMALVAIPGALSLLALALRTLRDGRRGEPAAFLRGMAILCLMLPAAVIVAKGALDVRFHLIYMPVLLLVVATGVNTWLTWLEHGHLGRFLAAATATGLYVAWTQSRMPAAPRWAWIGLGVAVALSAAGVAAHRIAPARLTAVLLALLSAQAAWASLATGPLQWGRVWAWEPSPLPDDTPREVASFPNADVQLVNCADGRELTDLTRGLALRALLRHPGDRETLLAVGPKLLDSTPEHAAAALRAAADFLRQRPDDAEVRQLVARGTLK